LYNALNAIAELCVDEPWQAERLTLQLSRYMRKSFDFKLIDSYTTLASELELVHAYVEIEQARFGSRLQVEYRIDADGGFRVPPLVLQPLVENAIRHGLLSDLRGGTVEISAKTLGDGSLRLSIEDDGCGMTEQQLRRLHDPESGGVGLRNIGKVLKLLYGVDIRIESAPGQGTRLSFDIPAAEEDDTAC